jgi:hypothetical protein
MSVLSTHNVPRTSCTINPCGPHPLSREIRSWARPKAASGRRWVTRLPISLVREALRLIDQVVR